MLLSIQTTVQDAVAQLRATERDKYFTFILDMACHGSRAILEEVKTRILDNVLNTDIYFRNPIESALWLTNHNSKKHETNITFSQRFSTYYQCVCQTIHFHEKGNLFDPIVRQCA